MSLVVDQIRRIDSQLDRLQLSRVQSGAEPWQSWILTQEEVHDVNITSRISHLQQLIKSLSTASVSKPSLLSASKILSALDPSVLSAKCSTCQIYFAQDEGDEAEAEEEKPDATYEHELEWLLVGKATVQAYGLILNTILEQTIPLSDDIWYWDDILDSYRYAGLYSIQTSPLRLWGWSKDVYNDVRAKGALADGWKHFYGLVRDVIHERSLSNIQKQVISPLAFVRTEARKRQAALKQLRHVNANALGVLLGEGLSNDSIHDEGLGSGVDAMAQEGRDKWKTTIAKTIALMEAVLQNASDSDLTTDKFDESIAATTQEDLYYELHEPTGERTALSLKPSQMADRLRRILLIRLDDYTSSLHSRSRQNGRPSRIIRYWFPISLAIVSSSTVFRLLFNRKEEILTWIREFGVTGMDFWSNWVVDPLKKLIGTIRHDEGSEISIMSKRSLEGDRASLERMVVDFALDNPENGSMGESDVAVIRNKIKEGDLTPVLKAYEKDMQKPLVGLVRGNLIRALLIQIQKTKVDVEVAISGIDSILKSQELLFGFIGLTPGVLVSIVVVQWLSGMFSSRKGLQKGTKQRQLVRILRNIDRVLVGATPTEFGELSYKDHGLLLCEVHLLRQTASTVLPRRTFSEFLEEIDDLVDVRAGLAKQQKVVDRIRWAYSKWIV